MKKIVFLFIISLLITSCTEPYALQTNTFEDALVIEATITNELKNHEIKISRTFALEEKEQQFEKNALVYITDDIGNTYSFTEVGDKYLSTEAFEALPSRQYQLFIETSNGKKYTSTREKLPSTSNQLEIEARKNNIEGVEGVEILANSFDPSNQSKYYRFEYEETYKIVSPYWTTESLSLIYNTNTFEVTPNISQKNYDSSICYNTLYSNELLLVNNSGNNEDKIIDYPVRFVPQNNHIIAYRYSILVKQYVQNLEAYTFYKTLKDFSGGGNVLSPNQPGFIEGNINNVNDSSEKVIGFFDVSSLSQKRIFFNYNDFFEGEPSEKYHVDCQLKYYSPSLQVVNCNGYFPPKTIPPYCVTGMYALYLAVEFFENELYFDDTYSTTTAICGECNRLWPTQQPSFWID